MMKRFWLLGFASLLLLAAAVSLVSSWNSRAKEGGTSAPAGDSGTRPGKSGISAERGDSSAAASRVAGEPLPGLETDELGIVDTAAYDADKDGLPEIPTYISIYGRLKTSAGKIDMLRNARILEPGDDQVVNDLIISEAARSEDPEVREAARDALIEYGDENAHDALADYLVTQKGILDLEELRRMLDRLALPSLPAGR